MLSKFGLLSPYKYVYFSHYLFLCMKIHIYKILLILKFSNLHRKTLLLNKSIENNVLLSSFALIR